MIGIPIVAALWVYRRGKEGFRPIWIGAAAFILSQVGHIPFNQYLMIPGLTFLGIDVTAQSGISLWVLGVAAGLSAGLFEEITRYLVLKFWLKKNPHTLLPLKYGIGHGGVEALLLGLLALYALVQVMVLRGEGVVAALGPEQAALVATQLEAFWAVPWYHSLLGALERISAMAFHIGASILVYKSVQTKNLIYLIIAILGHTLLNAFAVVAVKQMDFILLEGILLAFAASWLYWTWKIREIVPEEESDSPVPPQVQVSAAQISPEQIDESKYD